MNGYCPFCGGKLMELYPGGELYCEAIEDTEGLDVGGPFYCQEEDK